MLLNDLLVVLAPRIDHTRVVKMFQKADELPSKYSGLIPTTSADELLCSDQIVSHRRSACKYSLHCGLLGPTDS